MSIHEDWNDPDPRKKEGLSTTVKVLLIVGGVGTLFILLCCGGAFLLVGRFENILKEQGINLRDFAENAHVTDPDAIRERTQKIVKIEIMPGFEPQQAVDIVVMKFVQYGKANDANSVLMLMAFSNKFTGGQKPTQDEMLNAFRQQQARQGDAAGNNVAVQETETRELMVRGQKVAFQFIKGINETTGAVVREVLGSFPTQNGIGMLMLVVPEDEYDEPAVLKMIDSIDNPVVAEPGPAAGPADSTPPEESAPDETPSGEPARTPE